MMDQFSKLDNYESRFSEKVWEGISDHLEQKRQKKRRRKLLLFGTTATLLVTVAAGYFSFNNDAEHITSMHSSDGIENPMIHTESGLSKITQHHVVSQIDEVNNESTQASIERSGIAALHQSSYQSQLESSSPVVIAPRLDNPQTAGLVYKDLRSLDTSSKVIYISQRDVHAELRPSDSEYSQQGNSTILEKRDDIRPVQSIANLSDLSMIKSKRSLQALFVKEGCNLLEASPIKSYAWTQLSGFAPISSHTAKSVDAEDYATIRKSTEKVLLSPELGFGIGFKSKNGYFLESGFQIAYYREKLSYIDPESIKTQTVITIDSINNGGMLEVTADTTIVQIPGSREVINYNSHRTVSIPLVIGFDKYIGSSISIGGKVGTIFNLFKESEGRILDSDMVVRDILHEEGSSVDVYKNRLSTQFLLGSQIRYHFSPELDLYVNADIRFTPQSVTLDSYNLNQRFTSPILGAGLRYYF